MTTKMTFGECLKYLLTTLDISMSRLSKVINVDSSLISRWIHGKRIPPYDTPYIEDIAGYLAKNIHSTVQAEQLNKIFAEFQDIDGLIESDQRGKNQENIKKILLETRGYSVECKKNEQRKNKPALKNKNFTKDIDFSDGIQFPNSVSLSDADCIIYGNENILSAIITQLAAAERKGNHNNSIYIVLNCKSCDAFHGQWLEIRSALLRAMGNGWYVALVIQINHDTNQNMKLNKIIFPLIQTGKINIYYFNNYDIVTMERELSIIPGVSVISGFPPGTQSFTNSAFYLQSKAAVDIFTNYISNLIKIHTRKLLRYYLPDRREEYFCALTKVKKIKGNQLNYNCDFGTELISLQLYKKLMSRKKISPHNQQLSLEYYSRQSHAIKANLQNYKIKNIYFAETMENLVCHRTIYLNTYSGIEMIKMEIQDIIDYINNIIHFIHTYDNYEIAVIFQNSEKSKKHLAYQYVIKERHAVFFQTFEEKRSAPIVQLSMEEPTMIKACVESFEELWSCIAPVNKDKGEIITWLQGFVSMLQE